MRENRADLERALSGRVQPHQRFLLAEHLCHLDALDETIERVSQEIGKRLGPFEGEIARLQTVPGVGRRIAEALVAEIGTDLARFPTAHQLASWAGRCPGTYASAGKRQKGTTRKGSPWLRGALAEAAWAASHTKDTYLAAQYHRLAARRGRKRAIVAVGHSLLVIAYVLLSRQQDDTELGATYFDQRDQHVVQARLIHRLEHLGLKVTVEPTNPAA